MAKPDALYPKPNQDSDGGLTGPVIAACQNAPMAIAVRITSSNPVITICTRLVTSIPTMRTVAITRNQALAIAALRTTLLASAGSMKSSVAVASGRLPVTMKIIDATSSAQPEKKPQNFPNRTLVQR